MKYAGLEEFSKDLPEWQKQLVDERLAVLKAQPERLWPIEELMEELDKD